MKIARYKNNEYGFEFINEFYPDLNSIPESWIQISEPVEVEFSPINNEESLKVELAILDKQEKTILAETEVKLNAIRKRKSKLLSIEYKAD